MQSNKASLGSLVDNITNSKNPTEVSKTLKEIEENKDYIQDVQLRKLITLHDQSFKTKCVDPLTELYEKYSPLLERDGKIQNEAAIVDRNLRIIEQTLEFVRANQGK
ncbi:biogenesis of lysosome-related organelles complex 1 subunit Bls1p [Monosporozyma unispora]